MGCVKTPAGRKHNQLLFNIAAWICLITSRCFSHTVAHVWIAQIFILPRSNFNVGSQIKNILTRAATEDLSQVGDGVWCITVSVTFSLIMLCLCRRGRQGSVCGGVGGYYVWDQSRWVISAKKAKCHEGKIRGQNRFNSGKSLHAIHNNFHLVWFDTPLVKCNWIIKKLV